MESNMGLKNCSAGALYQPMITPLPIDIGCISPMNFEREWIKCMEEEDLVIICKTKGCVSRVFAAGYCHKCFLIYADTRDDYVVECDSCFEKKPACQFQYNSKKIAYVCRDCQRG